MLTCSRSAIARVSLNALTMISLSLALTTVSLQWSRLRSWTHSK